MNPNARVHTAYRSPYDGSVRWITHLSQRGYYHERWQDTEGRWHAGGKTHVRDFVGGEPADAPQPGDTFVLLGSTGYPNTWQIADDYTEHIADAQPA